MVSLFPKVYNRDGVFIADYEQVFNHSDTIFTALAQRGTLRTALLMRCVNAF